MTIFKIFM